MTTPKFFLDEHVPAAVAAQLRRRDIECITAGDAGRLGLADEAHLEWANSQGRIVVTFDDDFFALARAVEVHAGLIHCTPRTREIGPIVRGLLTFVAEHSAEEAANKTWYI